MYIDAIAWNGHAIGVCFFDQRIHLAFVDDQGCEEDISFYRRARKSAMNLLRAFNRALTCACILSCDLASRPFGSVMVCHCFGPYSPLFSIHLPRRFSTAAAHKLVVRVRYPHPTVLTLRGSSRRGRIGDQVGTARCAEVSLVTIKMDYMRVPASNPSPASSGMSSKCQALPVQYYDYAACRQESQASKDLCLTYVAPCRPPASPAGVYFTVRHILRASQIRRWLTSCYRA